MMHPLHGPSSHTGSVWWAHRGRRTAGLMKAFTAKVWNCFKERFITQFHFKCWNLSKVSKLMTYQIWEYRLVLTQFIIISFFKRRQLYKIRLNLKGCQILPLIPYLCDPSLWIPLISYQKNPSRVGPIVSQNKCIWFSLVANGLNFL